MRSIFCVLALAVGACSGSGNSPVSPEQELAAAKEKWRAAALLDYQYTLDMFCFCPSGSTTAGAGTYLISVKNGVVDSARRRSNGESLTREQASSLPTVDEIFSIIGSAYENRAELVDVEYHPMRGYPEVLNIDPSSRTADDERYYGVTELGPLPGAGSPT